MLDHARDRAIPSQTGRGHLEVVFRFICVGKMVFILMPWKLGLEHTLTMTFKLPTSMRPDYLHRSTTTNTPARNLTLLKQPQHDNPRLTLPGDSKHSSLDPGLKRISEWDGSLSGCGG